MSKRYSIDERYTTIHLLTDSFPNTNLPILTQQQPPVIHLMNNYSDAFASLL
ncbi:hypothetical protein [Xanthocytophaga agilis]|uniref:Uncharacterized protein n=1 Tax=Xanthocytophaga agilis TaxID=3048010 RepID=A0AAE3UHB3_9BACT|nr:hypothetical protein [Xanthocytophaga agilis]MDJ1503267.1 hypothetical protein [Xanthocytophaga agilis]